MPIDGNSMHKSDLYSRSNPPWTMYVIHDTVTEPSNFRPDLIDENWVTLPWSNDSNMDIWYNIAQIIIHKHIASWHWCMVN